MATASLKARLTRLERQASPTPTLAQIREAMEAVCFPASQQGRPATAAEADRLLELMALQAELYPAERMWVYGPVYALAMRRLKGATGAASCD
jgi:hypothetical protein